MKRIAKHLVNTEEDMLRETEFLSTIENQILPNNWCLISLKSIASILNGFAFKSDHYSVDGIRVIRITNVQDGFIEDNSPIFYPIETKKEIEKYLLQEDDLLISLTGNVGRVALLPASLLPAALNQRVGCIRTNGSIVSKKYLFYLFQGESFQKDCVKNAKGSAQLNMSTEWLKEQSVPLAPFPEQQRIVDRIESLFAKLDEAKEKAQAVIDGYEDRKAAILHKAFTGELTEEWRHSQNINEGSWERMTLNNVADYKKGPFGSSITKSMFVPRGEHTYKVYEQGNAIRKTLDYGHYYINEQKYSELKGFAVQAGDIIVSCAGTIGELYVLPEGCEAGIINQALMRVRVHSNINERFFSYFFGEVIKEDVIDQANGTAIKNIPPFKVMKAMEIRLPSLAEQEIIVNLLDKMLLKEEQARNIAKQVIDQIDSMKKSILARAFRGELGTNDPNDEPAIEFLKSIL